MGTVTKKDLIDRIADETGQRRTDVKKTLQEFLDQVVAELAKGNRLEFRDFGVFEVRERAARVAQNPKTLERVAVPPKRTIKFKPGRLMREGVETTAPSEAPVVETNTERLDPPQVETKPISPAEVRANG